jgi:hypothetical protein
MRGNHVVGGGRKRTRSEGWHRPSLPRGCPLSTIGAGGLNDRVREGTGCTPTATDTNHLTSGEDVAIIVHKRVTSEHPFLRITEDKPSTISTGSLNALRRVHVRPIQRVVYPRSYLVTQ